MVPRRALATSATPTVRLLTDVTLLAGGQLIQMNITASSGILPPYNGAYCGQLITMLEGPAQGYTSRIVGYAYMPVRGGTPYAAIQVMSFDGLAPNPGNGNYLGDQFVINGRAFSGTGFGFDLTNSVDAMGNLMLNTAVSSARIRPARWWRRISFLQAGRSAAHGERTVGRNHHAGQATRHGHAVRAFAEPRSASTDLVEHADDL